MSEYPKVELLPTDDWTRDDHKPHLVRVMLNAYQSTSVDLSNEALQSLVDQAAAVGFMAGAVSAEDELRVKLGMALAKLDAVRAVADEWESSAAEDDRYANRAHASEIHEVFADAKNKREHARDLREVLDGEHPTPECPPGQCAAINVFREGS